MEVIRPSVYHEVYMLMADRVAEQYVILHRKAVLKVVRSTEKRVPIKISIPVVKHHRRHRLSNQMFFSNEAPIFSGKLILRLITLSRPKTIF